MSELVLVEINRPVKVWSAASMPTVCAIEAAVAEEVVPAGVKLCENTPVPEARLKFLPAATVVSPFKETAPVPVLKVPDEADWS